MNTSRTPDARLEELVGQIRAAYANAADADYEYGYNKEAWAIVTALSDLELTDMLWTANLRVGVALTEGMIEKCDWVEDGLVIGGNLEEITFCKDLLFGVTCEVDRRMALPIPNSILASAGLGPVTEVPDEDDEDEVLVGSGE